jgi:hypothetical protein
MGLLYLYPFSDHSPDTLPFSKFRLQISFTATNKNVNPSETQTNNLIDSKNKDGQLEEQHGAYY